MPLLMELEFFLDGFQLVFYKDAAPNGARAGGFRRLYTDKYA
jgi:hypothetical protein